MKTKTISLRLPERDYNWLTQNPTNLSSYVLRLIQKARREDEAKPLKERIAETRKAIQDETKTLDLFEDNLSRHTQEGKIAVRGMEKALTQLESKLAVLEGETRREPK